MKRLPWLLSSALAATSAFALTIPPVILDIIRQVTIDIPGYAQGGTEEYTMFIRFVLFFLVYAILNVGLGKILPDPHKGSRIVVGIALALMSTILVPSELLTKITGVYSTIVILIGVLLPALLAVALWRWEPFQKEAETYAIKFIKGVILLILGYVYMFWAELFATLTPGLFPQGVFLSAYAPDISGWMGLAGAVSLIAGIWYMLPFGAIRAHKFEGIVTPGDLGGLGGTPGASNVQQAATATAQAAAGVQQAAEQIAQQIAQELKEDLQEAGKALKAFQQALEYIDSGNDANREGAIRAFPALAPAVIQQFRKVATPLNKIKNDFERLKANCRALTDLATTVTDLLERVTDQMFKETGEQFWMPVQARIGETCTKITESAELAKTSYNTTIDIMNSIAESIQKMGKQWWKGGAIARFKMRKVSDEFDMLESNLQKLQTDITALVPALESDSKKTATFFATVSAKLGLTP